MPRYPMTQDKLLEHAYELECLVCTQGFPYAEVKVQRFGDDTSPFYLITIDPSAYADCHSFRINIANGVWEEWYV